MKRLFSSACLCLAVLSFLSQGCQRQDSSPLKSDGLDTNPLDANKERRYTLKGVVRSVDRESGLVSIRHEAIADYMPEMTMSFPLSGQAVLEELQPGDAVRGTL